MQEKSDVQLLREFAEHGDQAAFSELVTRHTDLVYSSALRQLELPDVAADIAQGVFVDLARKAQSISERLTAESSLLGWLHRSTRYAALNHLRDTRRRLINERQAMEQLLTNSESSADWEQIRTSLDEALDSLEDGDREALLLRYFEKQDFRAVGRALGVSDDTAQKRVSRAVDRLREFFSKRGVTVGVSGLALAISANAVQAAPIGLATTISTAAVLTGTSVQTSTVAVAAKTIAMTTFQKSLLAIAFAAVVAVGIYQAQQNSTLRSQMQSLQQGQASLAEQNRHLSRERDETSNLLALVTKENARLKSAQEMSEVAKLRGKVGQLQEQAASAQARSNSPGFAKMMNDPAMKEFIHRSIFEMIRKRYGPLVRELNLTPEQTEKITQLLGNRFALGADRLSAVLDGKAAPSGPNEAWNQWSPEMKNEMREVLGDEGLARFEEFTKEVPARTTVDLLNNQLGSHPLTDEQATRLMQIVRAEPFDLTHGISGDFDRAFLGSPEQVESYLEKIRQSNQRVTQQATEFLSPEQLAGLNIVLSNGISLRTTQAAFMAPKR